MAESSSTLQARYDALNTAISAVETNGASISSDGTTYSRADLRAMYEQRARILAQLTQAKWADNGRSRYARTRITDIGGL